MDRGKFLLKRRTEKGLSQADIANELGYSPQLISSWELSKSSPDLIVAGKYASLLGLDLDGFINCEASKDNNICETKQFDISKFALNLKTLRKKNNLLQSDIAKKISVNKKTVGSWENGTSTPTIANFVALCKLYKLSYNELYFAYIDEKNKKNKPLRKKKVFLPIILPSLIATAAVVTASIIIPITIKNRKPVEIEHHYSEEYSFDSTGHWHACIDEGYSHLRTEVVPHTYTDVVVNPTYELDGYTSHTCDICGYSFNDTPVTHLEHTYSSTYEHDETHHWRECLDEGYEDLKAEYEEHIYSVLTTAATYEAPGKEVYTCSKCSHSYEVILPQLVHHYSDTWSKNETHHWHACADEGFEDLYIDKGKHTFEKEIVGGDAIYTCSECGYSYTQTLPFEVLDLTDNNGDNIFVAGAFEDIHIYLLNKDDLDIDQIYFKIGYDSFDGYEHGIFVNSGGFVYPTDSTYTHLVLKKEYFEAESSYANRDTYKFTITKIKSGSNTYDVPLKTFTIVSE